jgi:hypothetical protein
MENRVSFPKPFPLAFVSENINNAFEIIASYHSRHDLAQRQKQEEKVLERRLCFP